MQRALVFVLSAGAILAIVQVDCLDLGDAVKTDPADETDGSDVHSLPDGTGWLDNGTPCTCVLAPPLDWGGPLAVLEGALGSLPKCGGAYPTKVVGANADLVAPAAKCAPCTCSGANGSSCAPTMTIAPYTAAKCAGAACMGNVVTVSSESCTVLTGVGGAAGCGTAFAVAKAPQVQGGSCTPSAPQTLSVDKPVWGKEVVGCGSAFADPAPCGKGAVCVPEPPAGFENEPCVSKAGTLACPAGYPNKRVYYSSVTDDRSCGPCTCSAPSGYCDAMIAFYGGADCVNLLKPSEYISQGSCHETSGAVTVKTLVGQALGLACTAVGGPTGSAVPGDSITVCCR